MNAYCLHKKHNAEDVRLKARPVGRCPKARLRVIASHHAISMLLKQCLDPGFWASPEFMILNQRCPRAPLPETMDNEFIKISIIIPVLNEEINLPGVLNNLQSFRRKGHEVVVVDGGSSDNSLMLAQQAADIVIVSKAGRALQMNSGAAVATGDLFLFLHCDTRLADNALELVAGNYQKENYWGRFDVRLSGSKFVFRLIERLMNLRSRLTSIATGDQAIFIERKLFNQIDGFPEIALMEDITISGSLRKLSSPVCLKQKVITSSRRWENNGVVATTLLMWKLRLFYFFGVSPDKLSREYR